MSESKIVKGIAADISPELLERLENTFSLERAVYKQGDSFEDVAYRAGEANVVAWIKRHARTTVTPI
ncbi:hypothetical protein RHEph03_gp038 [Rhizobium phage RHEph03]|uniref:Uncharacterized protein n=3 Tax=Cuernavacavirus TaxID=2731935 RepID=A0A7S5R9X7_9CAUD|nr:hypothetical protein HOS21_gp38 [Rhizobium phage RHEph02]AGC35605.1 hypothetical protein RHEph02_gp038 [Rhizobium phage RHEph02]AGC35665.1 hypothetical protein RHEph03_gp038 [Rhizobium phage RHEph03]QIG68434.1 hypothetical protein EVB62_032 [Rhizobium phage RHph_TM33]QIG68490.1 hypothetical protein EVB63_031 [Rhizobium phage RHph_TM38]